MVFCFKFQFLFQFLGDCQLSKTVVQGFPSMLPKMRKRTTKMMTKIERPKIPSSELTKSNTSLVDSFIRQPCWRLGSGSSGPSASGSSLSELAVPSCCCSSMSKAVFLKHVNIGVVKIFGRWGLWSKLLLLLSGYSFLMRQVPLFLQINLEKSMVFRK